MQESGEDRSLDAALRAVAEAEAGTGASPEVEARLRAEVRSIGATRRRPVYTIAFAIAAGLLLAVGVPAWRTLSRRPPVDLRAREVTTEFLPLLYSNVPAASVQMIRLAVPRAALSSFGLAPPEVSDRTSTDTVLADILVGDDGLARAVRFVRPAADQEHLP